MAMLVSPCHLPSLFRKRAENFFFALLVTSRVEQHFLALLDTSSAAQTFFGPASEEGRKERGGDLFPPLSFPSLRGPKKVISALLLKWLN